MKLNEYNMRLNKYQFLGEENIFANELSAQYTILPAPYEGGVSYGVGAAKAPAAILEASRYIESYDEVLKIEPFRRGITTLRPLTIHETADKMHHAVSEAVREIMDAGKFPIVLGGDHSISGAVFRALKEKYEPLSCVQIDAHSDLRDSYMGSKLSHASVMARIREQTSHALQLGIRSMSVEEAQRIESEKLSVFTMNSVRSAGFDLHAELQKLPDPVFITLDVDALDWSVVWSTGTPEPGGFGWDEIVEILTALFKTKKVIGFDIVELAHAPFDRNSPIAVARLIYKMIGLHQVYNC